VDQSEEGHRGPQGYERDEPSLTARLRDPPGHRGHEQRPRDGHGVGESEVVIAFQRPDVDGEPEQAFIVRE
jgi:hypothetical protein